MHDRRSWRTRVRHDHSAMTGDSGAVTQNPRAASGAAGQKSLHRVGRPAGSSVAAQLASRFSASWGAWLGGVDGHRQDCVGGQFIVEAQDEGADDGVMEALDTCVVEAAVMRSPPGRNASLRVDSSSTSPDGSRS